MSVKQIPVSSLADSVMNIVLDGQSYNVRTQWNVRDESWYLYLGTVGGYKFKTKMRVGFDLLEQYSGYIDVPQGMLYVLDLNKRYGRLRRDSFSSGRMVLVYISEASKEALRDLNSIANVEMTVRSDLDDRFVTSGTEPTLLPPIILTQPSSTTVEDNSTATFNVAATSNITSILTYQWQQKIGPTWTNFSTQNPLLLTGTLALSGSQYRCIVSNSAGDTVSATATLNVVAIPVPLLPPVITSQPTSVTVNNYTNAVFNITATSNIPTTMIYSWQRFNGSTWTNVGTGTSLTVAAGSVQNGIQYRCVVTNTAGSATSNIVTTTLLADNIVTPSITSPSNNATNVDLPVTITTSAYSGDGAHVGTDYQLSTNSAFGSVLYSTLSTSLTSFTIPDGVMTTGLNYWIRCRHRNQNNYTSDWSGIVKITTAGATNLAQLIDLIDNHVVYTPTPVQVSIGS